MAAKVKTGWCWVIGLCVVVGPYLLLEVVAPDDVGKWSRIYIAGAVGGICFELVRNRWRLELPSGERGIGKHPEPTFAPFGPLSDIGFLGRMATAGVVAPAFIAIVNTLDASSRQSSDLGGYLSSLATRADTIAWAVAVGFAAPAVWSLMEGFVKARGAVASTRLEIMQAQVDVAKEKVKKLQPATPAAGGDAAEITVVPDGKAVIEKHRRRGQHEHAELLTKLLAADETLRVPVMNGVKTLEDHTAVSEALGALDAASQVGHTAETDA